MPLVYDTPPANDPVDLTELKDHLRIGDSTDYDSVLGKLISATCGKDEIDNPAQFAIRRQLIKATLVFTLNKMPEEKKRRFCLPEFPGNQRLIRKIELPRPPLISVSTVEFRDEDGVWQTVDSSNYEVNSDASPGFIQFLDYEFPDFYEHEEFPIKITYTAGYQSSDGLTSTFEHVPDNIQLWIMNHIGDYFEERKSELITNMDVVELRAAMGRLIAPHNAARRFA